MQQVAHHKQHRRLVTLVAPATVLGLAALATRLPLAQRYPALALALFLWLAADSLMLARLADADGKRPAANQIVATLAAACAIVAIASPPPLQAALRTMPAALGGMVLVLLAHVGMATVRARGIVLGADRDARWERAAAQFLPAPLVRFARLELAVLHIALLRWGGPADVPPGARAFAYHRHLTPMAIALLSLSAIEVAVYHLFLGHWSRVAALAMFMVSDLGLVYLVGLVKSFRFRPILIDGDGVRVRAGFLIDLPVPLAQIDRVTMAFSGDEMRDSGTLNAALLAWPNVVIYLRAPVVRTTWLRRGAYQRVAFRLDEPEPFVRLLHWRLGNP